MRQILKLDDNVQGYIFPDDHIEIIINKQKTDFKFISLIRETIIDDETGEEEGHVDYIEIES